MYQWVITKLRWFFFYLSDARLIETTVIPLYRETKYSLECQILSFSDIFLHSYRYGKCLLVKINYNFIFDQTDENDQYHIFSGFSEVPEVLL